MEFGTILFKIDEKIFKMQVWDTAGQESFKAITKIFYRGAHCVFFCFDLTNSDSFNNVAQWQEEMLS